MILKAGCRIGQLVAERWTTQKHTVQGGVGVHGSIDMPHIPIYCNSLLIEPSWGQVTGNRSPTGLWVDAELSDYPTV